MGWVVSFTSLPPYVWEAAPVPIVEQAEWTPEPLWALWRREKSLAPTETRNGTPQLSNPYPSHYTDWAILAFFLILPYTVKSSVTATPKKKKKKGYHRSHRETLSPSFYRCQTVVTRLIWIRETIKSIERAILIPTASTVSAQLILGKPVRNIISRCVFASNIFTACILLCITVQHYYDRQRNKSQTNKPTINKC
jgi:hypothetical protein